MPTATQVFGTKLAAGIAAAYPQPDGTIVVDNIPLFSEVRETDPGVQAGVRQVRDRSWIENAIGKTRARIAAGKKPIMTLRHIFDDPERVGTFEPTRCELAEVNPDEEPRWTAFGRKIYESREAFEKAKDYDFRSIEISPDSPDEFGALALLRDKEPFHKYPNLRETLVAISPSIADAFEAEAVRGLAQVWRGGVETFASAEDGLVARAAEAQRGKLERTSGRAQYFSFYDEKDARPWINQMTRLGYEVRYDHHDGNRPVYFVPFAADRDGKFQAVGATATSFNDVGAKGHACPLPMGEHTASNPYAVAQSMLESGRITKAQFDDVVSAIKRESHEGTKEGNMPAETKVEKKEPSIDERMEAALNKGFEAMAAKFEAMIKKYAAGGDEKHAEPDGDEKKPAAHEDKKPEHHEEKKEEVHASAPKGPDPVPAVQQAAQGETFAALTTVEKAELLGLRAYVKRKQVEEQVEQFAAEGEKALVAAGVTLGNDDRAFLREKAKAGKVAVDAFVEGTIRYAKTAARAPEAFGLLGGAQSAPAASAFDADVQKAMETFGSRPEAKARIASLANEFRGQGEFFIRNIAPGVFFDTCVGSPDINPAIMGARGGFPRKG